VKLEKLIHQRYPLKWKGSSKRWMVPKAGEPSSLVIDTKFQRFFWYAKGLVGGTYVWMRDVLRMPEIDVLRDSFDTIACDEASPPTENDVGRYHYALMRYGKGASYIIGRGIGKRAAEHFRLGYSDEYDGSITIPYYLDGELTGIKLRVISREGIRYRAVAGSKFSLYNKGRVIVEGEFKAIHLWQIGIEAMSLPAMGFNNDHIRARLQGQYLYMRDNDKAGFMSALCGLKHGLDLVVTSTPSHKSIDDYIISEGETSWLRGLIARYGKS